MAHRCPKCNSERVRRSRRRGVLERTLCLVGLSARRCHECNVRFLTLGNSTLFRRDLDNLVRKASVVAAAGIALLVVVIAVLWLSRSEAPTSSTLFPQPGSAPAHAYTKRT